MGASVTQTGLGSADAIPSAISDPLERELAEALTLGRYSFRHESQGGTNGLDFYLPGYDLYIEVKQFHAARISDQMARGANVIAIQGREGVRFIAELLGSV